MKENENEVKLKVLMNYNFILPLIIGFVMSLFLILPFLVFKYKSNQEEFLVKFFWSIIFSIFTIFCFLYSLLNIQTAILNEKSIKIKSVLHTIKILNWREIKKVDIQKLATMSSSAIKIWYYDWIVIYTNDDQKAKYGGHNTKKKGPWQIKATQKNIDIINKFVKKYCDKGTKIDLD